MEKIRWIDEENRYRPDTTHKTAFEILGCSETDSDAMIKRQYRRMVGQYHPDRWKEFMIPWATRQLQAINLAYDEIIASRKSNDA
jgi:DnaJ-class molecular chaperone